MEVTLKMTEGYQKEVRELFQDRLGETEQGRKIFKVKQFKNFEDALLNFHTVSEVYRDELEWCLSSSVLDASETLILEFLQEVGYYKGNLDEGYPDSESESLMDDDEGRIWIKTRIKSIITFSIGFSSEDFRNIKVLQKKLQQSFNQIPVLRNRKNEVC